MPVFNDSDSIPALLPEGDYVFWVAGLECKISNGKKTCGCDQFALELRIEPTNKPVYETLTDHPSCSWKIDTFLKSAGVRLAKGEAYDFREEVARASGVKFVNPLGLRGWCHLIEDTLPPKPDRKPLTINKVGVFYTDKPKLEPKAVEGKDENTPF